MSASVDALQLAIAELDSTPVASTSQGANGTPAAVSAATAAGTGSAHDSKPTGGRPVASASMRGQRPADVPRVMLTICEAASSLGVSSDTFRRFVLPELRVVRASPRLTLVRVAELERWAARREAVSELG